MANSVKAPGCSVEPAAGSGRSDSYFRTELGGFLEGPAGSLLQRHAEGLIIVLRDDGRFQQDLVDDGLIAQRSDRHHGAEAALREASIVAAGEQLAGFDASIASLVPLMPITCAFRFAPSSASMTPRCLRARCRRRTGRSGGLHRHTA